MNGKNKFTYPKIEIIQIYIEMQTYYIIMIMSFKWPLYNSKTCFCSESISLKGRHLN